MNGLSHCRKCHRRLTNPVSVEIGMGPVCRANHDAQEEFGFMNAQYEVLRHESGQFIFIRDIGHNAGRTVTNDAEHVINQLYEEEGITDETRIFYEDSEGSADEIIHAGKIFKGFKAGHEGVDIK